MLQDILTAIVGVIATGLGVLTVGFKKKINDGKEAGKEQQKIICEKIELLKKQNDLITRLLNEATERYTQQENK